jgi:glycosyltransferase involved in cell wall biosynthesis
MKLSIITINWNNADGLQKTIQSVVSQTSKDFEYVVIDGGSTDGSVEVIKKYSESFPINWLSEPDKGIYNAMNKGIRRASGEYLHFLNSGDILYDDNVVAQMYERIEECGHPDMLTGIMYKKMVDGRLFRSPVSRNYSFLRFYNSSLNHPSTYIKRELFDKYGLYDESLKIVSDWKWFMQVVAMHGVKPTAVDVNITIFDITGISETNINLRDSERRSVLTDAVPQSVLADYDCYNKDINMMNRLRRHRWAYRITYVLERMLFKIEQRKWQKENISTR